MVYLFVLLLIVLAIVLFLDSERFGARASGERLDRILASPQYRKGQFQNESDTPNFTEGATMATALRAFFFEQSKRKEPKAAIPAVKVDLNTLPKDEDLLIWFGQSCYFLQLGGRRFLVDPVLSGNASPLRFTTRAFTGADAYTVDDLPYIDHLLISHDHWDHLDYRTVVPLKNRVGSVITGLGTGAHFERWGFDMTKVQECDWHDQLDLGAGFTLHTAPARHFSGRGFRRNGVLWLSFILQTPSMKLYLGGDSGYDAHFRRIGEVHGPFDLAILECGQYNRYWKNIHMMPEEVVQAAEDLGAKALLPVHWGKFALALHDWDEPIERVLAEAGRRGLPTFHPRIGEPLHLHAPSQGEQWWQGL